MDEVVDRVQRLFEISSLKCSCCGELGHLQEETGMGEVETSPEHYGIRSLRDWDEKMDEYLEWARENREQVLAALPELEEEWPNSCSAFREVLKRAE